MDKSRIHFQSDVRSGKRFRTAVSLHGHTLCSRETLNFLNRLARRSTYIRTALKRGEARYLAAHGTPLDLSRAWWTPPIAPRDAVLLERRHIQHQLGCLPLVSLTDHDDIDAPLQLQMFEDCRQTPVSVEWTVPYSGTFFHLGVHNLALERARETMGELRAYTAAPHASRLAPLLEALSARADTLIVFNHPCWDECGIGAEQHRALATSFARAYGAWLHAFEVNGLRPWHENRAAIRMSAEFGKPLISGGDRHALEPNTILDLTDAATFSEFVAQVRSGNTNVLITDQYREPFGLRIFQSLEEIMGTQENHGRGWRRWRDRVFYRCDDGIVRSLATIFENYRVPTAMKLFEKVMDATRIHRMSQTFRFAFPRRQELAL